MAEWTIAGLLAGILVILYVELRESARAHRLMEKKYDDLQAAMTRDIGRLEQIVRDLRSFVQGEST